MKKVVAIKKPRAPSPSPRKFFGNFKSKNKKSRSKVATQIEIPDDLTPFINGNNEFAKECNKIIRDGTATNSVYSPFFIRNLLAILRISTFDLSAFQIDRSLRLTSEFGGAFHFGTFSKVWKNILDALQAINQNGSVSITCADRIYLAKGFEISKGFKESIKNFFQAEIHQIDFTNTTYAATEINSWINEVTSSKIQNIIEPNMLTGIHTRLVLISASHFSGDWVNKFYTRNTYKAMFRVSDEKEVQCSMMMRKGKTWFAELNDIKCQAIGLPFMGGQLMLVIIYSKLEDIHPIQSVTGESGHQKARRDYNVYRYKYDIDINQVVSKLAENEMEIRLPRFTIESTTHFIQPLKQLGVSAIFDPCSSNFSPMTGYNVDGLFVSEIIQKVVLQITESPQTRVESAPAKKKRITPIVHLGPRDKNVKKSPKSITIDHPFVFYIIDKTNQNLILFYGLCSNPTVSAEGIHPLRKYEPKSLITQKLHDSGVC